MDDFIKAEPPPEKQSEENDAPQNDGPENDGPENDGYASYTVTSKPLTEDQSVPDDEGDEQKTEAEKDSSLRETFERWAESFIAWTNSWPIEYAPGIWDKGDQLKMKVKGDLTEQHIQNLISLSMEKGWNKIYIYQDDGHSFDAQMSMRIQSTIIQMGLAGQIQCCTDPMEAARMADGIHDSETEDETEEESAAEKVDEDHNERPSFKLNSP